MPKISGTATEQTLLWDDFLLPKARTVSKRGAGFTFWSGLVTFRGVYRIKRSQSFARRVHEPSLYAGDFFSGEIPPADLYVLARIIHDWPEEKCLSLLKKIHDACKPGVCVHGIK